MKRLKWNPSPLTAQERYELIVGALVMALIAVYVLVAIFLQ
jgi:hypothetical protein